MSETTDVLARLYEATNGAAWIDNEGWLGGGSVCDWRGIDCSNTTASLAGNGAALSTVHNLTLSRSSLSGFITTELGLLTGLTVLSIAFNAVSGSIPSELGLLTGLTGLSMPYNAVSGSIPSELGLLTGLTGLSMPYNAVSGSIPSELGLLTGLAGWRSMHMEEMALSFPPPHEVDVLCQPGTCTGLSGCVDAAESCPSVRVGDKVCSVPARICLGGDDNDGWERWGLSGLSRFDPDCSAFAAAVPSTTDPNRCTACDAGIEAYVALGIFALALVLFGCMALALLLRASRMRPLQFRWWLSTCVILYYHSLNINIVASLNIQWPPVFSEISRVFSLDHLLSLPGVECLVPDGTFSSLGGDTVPILFLLLTIVKFSVVVCASVVGFWKIHRSSGELRDRWVRLASCLLIFMFLSLCRLVDNFSLFLYYAADDGALTSNGMLWLFLLVVVYTILFPLFFFRVHVDAYARGIATGEWNIPASRSSRWESFKIIKIIIKIMTTEIFKRHRNVARRLIFIPRSPDQLETRLELFVHRFAAHAPKWQFALCARLTL